jgi:hypothetical protein
VSHHQEIEQDRSSSRAIRRPKQTIGLAVILTALGADMVVRSSRWYKTPSYGNLLKIMPADAWGAIYLGVALVVVLGLVLKTNRIVRLGGHTLAFVLLLGWEFAFVIRSITDSGTTIANVVSWGTYLTLALWSGQLIDRPDRQ